MNTALIVLALSSPAAHIYGVSTGDSFSFAGQPRLAELHDAWLGISVAVPGYQGTSIQVPGFSMTLGGHALQFGPTNAAFFCTSDGGDPFDLSSTPAWSYYCFEADLPDAQQESILASLKEQINDGLVSFAFSPIEDDPYVGPWVTTFIGDVTLAGGPPIGSGQVPEPTSIALWVVAAAAAASGARRRSASPSRLQMGSHQQRPVLLQ